MSLQDWINKKKKQRDSLTNSKKMWKTWNLLGRKISISKIWCLLHHLKKSLLIRTEKSSLKMKFSDVSGLFLNWIITQVALIDAPHFIRSLNFKTRQKTWQIIRFNLLRAHKQNRWQRRIGKWEDSSLESTGQSDTWTFWHNRWNGSIGWWSA